MGPRTYLGLQTAGFPNLFIAISAAFCNYPVCAEIDCGMDYRLHPLYAREGLQAHCSHAAGGRGLGGARQLELAEGTLFAAGNSWFMGANIPGKKRVFLLYANTAPAYREKCAEVAAKGYEGFYVQ